MTRSACRKQALNRARPRDTKALRDAGRRAQPCAVTNPPTAEPTSHASATAPVRVPRGTSRHRASAPSWHESRWLTLLRGPQTSQGPARCGFAGRVSLRTPCSWRLLQWPCSLERRARPMAITPRPTASSARVPPGAREGRGRVLGSAAPNRRRLRLICGSIHAH